MQDCRCQPLGRHRCRQVFPIRTRSHAFDAGSPDQLGRFSTTPRRRCDRTGTALSPWTHRPIPPHPKRQMSPNNGSSRTILLPRSRLGCSRCVHEQHADRPRLQPPWPRPLPAHEPFGPVPVACSRRVPPRPRPSALTQSFDAQLSRCLTRTACMFAPLFTFGTASEQRPLPTLCAVKRAAHTSRPVFSWVAPDSRGTP